MIHCWDDEPAIEKSSMTRSTWLYLDLVKFHREDGGRVGSRGNYYHRVGRRKVPEKKEREDATRPCYCSNVGAIPTMVYIPHAGAGFMISELVRDRGYFLAICSQETARSRKNERE